MEDLFGDELCDGLEIREGTAGGDARVFEKRGVEKEGAAINEGMMGRFERLAATPPGAGAFENGFVEL